MVLGHLRVIMFQEYCEKNKSLIFIRDFIILGLSERKKLQ